MARAAAAHNIAPRTISFEGTNHTLLAFQPQLAQCRSDDYHRLHAVLLAAIATHRVGDRPNRIEPRTRKRLLTSNND